MKCDIRIVCAPSYANMFLVQFEEKHMYTYIKDISLLYLRYKDDISIK